MRKGNGVPGVKSRGLWAKEIFTKRNRKQSRDEVLRLYNAKEVSYAQLTGTPGLPFRSGRTMLSYQWSPIAPASPTATRTRTKSKSWYIVLLSHKFGLLPLWYNIEILSIPCQENCVAYAISHLLCSWSNTWYTCVLWLLASSGDYPLDEPPLNEGIHHYSVL